jgi:hypothetical protein
VASRAWGGLERGGESPEGASGPRARRGITRGGVRPSSEAEFTRRGIRPLSEVENRPRGTATSGLVGRCGFFRQWAIPLWAATTWSMFLGFTTCLFVFYYFSKRGFSLVIRGPLWLSLTVAPEPLRWYQLGTRRG